MKVLLTAWLLSLSVWCWAQYEAWSLAYWNVENLFDTVHDTGRNDFEFTPAGWKHWDAPMYAHKQQVLAEEFSRMDKAWNLRLIGLGEVENRRVLEDLVGHPQFPKKHWGILHRESLDERGIDCALLYDSTFFRLLNVAWITPALPDTADETRDMLVAVGTLPGGNTIGVAVLHWPSRYHGYIGSIPGRMAASACLSQALDSLNSQQQIPFYIIGDFNDEPTDSSVTTLVTTHRLTNLALPRMREDSIGTLQYQGRWQWFDQILACPMEPTHWLVDSTMTVWAPPHRFEPDPKYGGLRPLRTHYGKEYVKGPSDHMAVGLRFWPRR